jgi:aspartate kinase
VIVMKFGGTSVESAEAIRRAAEIIRTRRKQDPVVVVSAMAKVTDQLVMMGQKASEGDPEGALELVAPLRKRHHEAASQLLSAKVLRKITGKLDSTFNQLEDFLRGVAAVRELSPRSSDYLLSFGELLSSQFIAPALTEAGLEAEWVDSRECVITNGMHTRAIPQMEETCERAQAVIRPILAKHRIPVMGGFIASSLDGVPTTLGRGGSDYSAAIIGAALDAECIEIWTDVEGMMTTDPRLCPEARTIRRISFNEAAELAYFGAKVLHPATLLPAIEKNIPVYVLNSRNVKSKGTRITTHAPAGDEMFRAITAKKGISLVNVVASRGLMVHNFLRSVFEVLDQNGASVDLVAISEVSLSLTMESKRIPEKLLSQLGEIADITCEEEQAIICLVGEDIHGRPGIAASVFSTVANAGVNVRMISQGASEINISFVVKESDVPRAVQHLHAKFFAEAANRGSAAVQRESPSVRAAKNGNGHKQIHSNGNGGAAKEKHAKMRSAVATTLRK